MIQIIKKIKLFVCLNIIRIYKFLLNINFIHFFLVGISGLIINLSLTTFFTEFIFGRKKYFYGYLIGLISNLLYNFILHSIITFKIKKNHSKRFLVFIIYNLIMSFIQAILIKKIVNYFGVDYYLFIIILVIGFFFIVNFFVSKLLLFKK